jgi:hypothetical protein
VLVPVFFADEDTSYEPQLIDFVNKIGATDYWTAISSEYGVGPATSGTPVVLTEMAPTTIDDSAIQTWLAAKLNGDDALWQAPDANTVYILHYPAGSTITLQGEHSCSEFGGYHNSITLDAAHGSLPVAYAVLPQCGDFGNLKGVDAVTGAESHEIIEASTDPYPETTTAYGQVDNAHLYWLFALGGGEVGDMCAQFRHVFTKFPELPLYSVQRSWSNQAALAGHDPCVPQPEGEVYFNAAPVLPDNINFTGIGTMKGVKVPVGQSKTIEIDLFSDGDTGGEWDVEAMDFGPYLGMASTLDLSLDRNFGQNGEKLHLTITSTATSQYGASIFLLTSKSGQSENWWFGLVGN